MEWAKNLQKSHNRWQKESGETKGETDTHLKQNTRNNIAIRQAIRRLVSAIAGTMHGTMQELNGIVGIPVVIFALGRCGYVWFAFDMNALWLCTRKRMLVVRVHLHTHQLSTTNNYHSTLCRRFFIIFIRLCASKPMASWLSSDYNNKMKASQLRLTAEKISSGISDQNRPYASVPWLGFKKDHKKSGPSESIMC